MVPKSRGGFRSLSKAMVYHHQGKTIDWDLVLVLMFVFLTNFLSEKAIERLGGGEVDENFHGENEKGAENKLMKK